MPNAIYISSSAVKADFSEKQHAKLMNPSENSSEQLENAYRYCESVTRQHAKSFYFAAKFLPAAKRRAVYPIYAFCRHVDDEIDELGGGSGGEDEAAAILTVERWRRNLEAVYPPETKVQGSKFQVPSDEFRDANAKNEVRESEVEQQKPPSENQTLVFSAWRDLLNQYAIPRRLPLELIKGVLMDTHIKRYETFDDLYVYCYRVASTVGLMSSEILGYRDESALRYAEAMGIAMQLTNILRDVKEDAAMNRIYLPQEDLRGFGVSEQQIFADEFDENFRALIKFEVARARDYYAEGEKGIRLLTRDARFTVLLAARIYAKILDEIEKQNYNIFTKRAHTTRRQKLFALPKIWLGWRKL